MNYQESTTQRKQIWLRAYKTTKNANSISVICMQAMCQNVSLQYLLRPIIKSHRFAIFKVQSFMQISDMKANENNFSNRKKNTFKVTEETVIIHYILQLLNITECKRSFWNTCKVANLCLTCGKLANLSMYLFTDHTTWDYFFFFLSVSQISAQIVADSSNSC